MVETRRRVTAEEVLEIHKGAKNAKRGPTIP